MITDVASPAPPVRRSWSAWRTILVIVGALLVLLGGTVLAFGAVALGAHQQHDGDGYLTTDTKQFSTDTFALSAPSLDVDVTGPDAFYADRLLGDVRIRGESSKAGTPLFIGIGPADSVAKYLEGVGHAEVSDIGVDPFTVTYTPRPGAAPTALPADQSFWVASETGTGPRTLVWNVAGGNWAVVIMNADGSAGVTADLDAGATLPVILPLAIGALVAGGLLMIIGLGVIVVTIATRGRTTAAT
jgi:hypothetical protein